MTHYKQSMQSMKDIDSVNLDDLPDEPVSSNNFEDCLDHYYLLGEGLSRKSVHQDKQKFRKNILLLDPNRN